HTEWIGADVFYGAVRLGQMFKALKQRHGSGFLLQLAYCVGQIAHRLDIGNEVQRDRDIEAVFQFHDHVHHGKRIQIQLSGDICARLNGFAGLVELLQDGNHLIDDILIHSEQLGCLSLHQDDARS
ncbi:MAG: hypothetical protein OEU92_28825, partial [Alphaproteobacteria bacterium]|nr:hypothetical protein [Alphaproteobacteria bacterium]